MGFDLYGTAALSAEGEYFRNNVWWWRPLWDYICDICNDFLTAKDMNKGGYNNGDTISRTKALKIAKRIKKYHKSGKLDEYAVNYKHRLDELPDSDCDICSSTGKRKSIPERGAGNIHCNGCDGTGKQRNWGKSYPFDVNNVLEFVTFAENSGGFQIC